MARYQILYWRHIPLGVKAIDIDGMVRENLPAQFQEIFQKAVLQQQHPAEAAYTTSGFRWGQEGEREGSATAVATTIIDELVKTWNHEKALALFEQQNAQDTLQFLNLNPEA